MAEEMSEQQAQDILRQYAESKANMHTFFTNVVKTKNTLKTGNLSIDELGISNLPVRTNKELELFSREILDQEEWADYFNKMAEIQTASSLSKEGFFLKLSVTNKKELADVTPKQKGTNKGWFNKNNKGGTSE